MNKPTKRKRLVAIAALAVVALAAHRVEYAEETVTRLWKSVAGPRFVQYPDILVYDDRDETRRVSEFKENGGCTKVKRIHTAYQKSGWYEASQYLTERAGEGANVVEIKDVDGYPTRGTYTYWSATFNCPEEVIKKVKSFVTVKENRVERR